MWQPRQDPGNSRSSPRETSRIALLAVYVSFISFLVFFRLGALLFYGDAVAHINIARRVFDSRTPGLLQLGTVWLPLPHLLMIPFLVSSWMWRTGVGGSIPSTVAYVAGVSGIYRLARESLTGPLAPPSLEAIIPAGLAACVYALNPNLLYLQTTAMTESLYLALFVWSMVFFVAYLREISTEEPDSRISSSASLGKCGLCLVAAELTRYDGWFLTVITVAALLLSSRKEPRSPASARSVRNFILLVAAPPVLWLAYNAIVYRHPLEFATGPYSARAIEMRSGAPTHPGARNLPVAFAYFFKSAELNLAEGHWQKVWIGIAIVASLFVLTLARRLAPMLLLWLPLPFYVLSIAYAGVPLYVPPWWPFSLYNLRYGIQLLPLFAISAAMVAFSVSYITKNRIVHWAVAVSALTLAVGSYVSAWRAGPICYREAQVNSRTRIALETELARELRRIPPDSLLLMYLGDHAGALQQAGIPLDRTINESNHRSWKQPSDPDGLWERALADPPAYVDYVVAIEGDPVAATVHRRGLEIVVRIHASGQPEVTIYRARPNLPVISHVNADSSVSP